MVIRRGIGTILSFVGLLYLTRIVGPGAYGLFTSVFGLVGYLQMLVQMGLGVYLIRSPLDTPREHFHQVFWWLLVSSLFATLIGIALFILVGQFWVRQEGFVPVAVAMGLLLPIMVLPTVPLALLERDLDYRRVSWIEIGSQVAYYAVGIGMAWTGWGAWALVSAFAVSQLVLLAGFYGITRYRPRWYWNSELLRDMLHYSFTQGLSGWLYNLRTVAPSLILLPIAGKEAVGYYNLAYRFVTVLNFASEALGRITYPAFARIQHDLPKLCRAVNEGMYLRLLATGIFYAGFASIAWIALPWMLGAKWNIQILLWVFSLLAVPMLVGAIVGIQASALHVICRNGVVALSNLFYIIFYFAFSWVLVYWLASGLKVHGFALASWFAIIPNFIILHLGFSRFIGSPSYLLASLWLVGFSLILLVPVVSGWLAVLALPFLVNPLSFRTVRQLISQIRALRQSTPTPVEAFQSDLTP